MSRCFPFPPPGYEKKLITDEPDLLKKEKRKEKKHKKDKKDKEKKEGKEKREKDRSEGKHKDKKEKKEKKEKHRDKKKDKEKSKNSSFPDEKKLHGQFEGYNGEKLHHNNEQNKDKIQFPSQNGDLARNRIRVGDTENFKFVEELDRRIRDEEKGTGSHQFVVEGRKNSVNKIDIQKMDRWQAINGAPPPPPPPLDHRRIEQKEKMQESDDKRGDKRKNKQREKEEKLKEKSEQKKTERDKKKHIKKSEFNSVGIYNNLSANPLENSFQGVGNEGNLKKRKDMETNGGSHENEPRSNKMARHMTNISPENGRKIDVLQNPGSSSVSGLGLSLLDKQGASLNSFKVGSSKGQGQGQKVNGMTASQPVSVSAKKPPVSAFSHIPSKPSPIKSPPVITNDVAFQSSPKPPPPPSISPPPPPPPVSRPKPPPAVVIKVAAPPPPPPLPIPKKKPPKPPHPDTKYLSQILTVPKLDPWCGLDDDQEWLVNKKVGPTSKKTTTEDLQVWSEAKHIESVDICALPYVIPY